MSIRFLNIQLSNEKITKLKKNKRKTYLTNEKQ